MRTGSINPAYTVTASSDHSTDDAKASMVAYSRRVLAGSWCVPTVRAPHMSTPPMARKVRTHATRYATAQAAVRYAKKPPVMAAFTMASRFRVITSVPGGRFNSSTTETDMHVVDVIVFVVVLRARGAVCVPVCGVVLCRALYEQRSLQTHHDSTAYSHMLATGA